MIDPKPGWDVGAASQGMGRCSFLPPSLGAALPPCLPKQCPQDGCSQLTRHLGTLLPGKTVPGKSTRPRPARAAPAPKREAEHPWDTSLRAADRVRLSSPRSAHPNRLPGKHDLPGTSASPCHTTPALPCHRARPRGRGLSWQLLAGVAAARCRGPAGAGLACGWAGRLPAPAA